MTMTITKRTSPMQLHYRPKTFDEVIGQPTAVKLMKEMLSEPKRPHTILIVGPWGTGKTTLARIIADKVGAVGSGAIIELDGATSGKIEDIRELVAQMDYMPPNGSKAKVAIIDECHAISTAAWQSFLKSTEEPPRHVYYVFCTTALKKVPGPLKSRATTFELKPVTERTLIQYAKDKILPTEGIQMGEQALSAIAQAASGSPRQFLNFLDQCKSLTDIKEIREVLSSAQADEDDPAIKFIRLAANGVHDFAAYQKAASEVTDFGRIGPVMKAWLAKSFLNEPSMYKVAVVLEAMDKMSEYPSDATDLLLFAARVCNGLGRQAK